MVDMDSMHDATRIERFWASTGLSPVFSINGIEPPVPGERNAKCLLSADEFTNIALIGSLPKGQYLYNISLESSLLALKK
jgi:hypothetical protein